MKVIYDLVIPIIKDAYKRQGVSFIILLSAIGYFHIQITKLEEKTEQCNERLIEYMAQSQEESIKVIQRNTDVLERILKK